MSKILIFSGTTEGRKLAEVLSENGIDTVISVATEYGESVMPRLSHVQVHTGRMEPEQMRNFMEKEAFCAVVDATHPFATVVSKHIQESLEETDIPYLRLKRDTAVKERDQVAAGESNLQAFNHKNGKIQYFESAPQCEEALEHTQGNILLTTGSKELEIYCKTPSVKERLYVRILPGMESLAACEKQGICTKQVIAMQGPFSRQMNLAILKQFDIQHLVTKESGQAGGYQEKLEAAARQDILVYVIGNPEKELPGDSFGEVCRKLSEITGTKLMNHIALTGMGMGTKNCLTLEAQKAIDQADYLFGAPRLLEQVKAEGIKRPFYLAKDILPCLDQLTGMGQNIVVLFSGDTGFYSGCSKLYEALRERKDCRTTVYPGISSVSYLSACTGIPWQDGKIYSIHGHGERQNEGKAESAFYNAGWTAELINIIRYEPKTYLLTSGVKDVQLLGKLLLEAGLDSCKIFAGYQLSYPEQQILKLTPKSCKDVEGEGLYVCMILNPKSTARPLFHGMKDDAFIRGKVPMTKEEIREISICKMGLTENSVVYDIGSGTGSVAVEIAQRSPGTFVYAVEKKPQALELIKENQAKFGVPNLMVIKGEAPQALQPLPAPAHVFIGGSGGKLKDILDILYEKNPGMRIVVNAVSLETIAELSALKTDRRIRELEIVQVQVSRAEHIGEYQLMRGENPIYICTFNFGKGNE